MTSWVRLSRARPKKALTSPAAYQRRRGRTAPQPARVIGAARSASSSWRAQPLTRWATA